MCQGLIDNQFKVLLIDWTYHARSAFRRCLNGLYSSKSSHTVFQVMDRYLSCKQEVRKVTSRLLSFGRRPVRR